MSPATDALNDIDLHCTDEELIISLENIKRSSSLPRNVITDVNPYQYLPSNLPGGVLFLIQSKEASKDKLGFWKPKKDACKVFSDSSITGWKTTHEFYEGQAPDEHKTGWVIQEYKITKEGECENTTEEEVSSICRVFLATELVSDPGKGQSTAAALGIATENGIRDTKSSIPDAMSAIGQGSPRNFLVEEDDRVEISAEREPLPLENLLDIDLGWNDFIELQDLETPLSLSSSENSSCLTMSSDEYFDSLALLLELDADNNAGTTQKAGECKFSVSKTLTPEKVVMPPASSARSNDIRNAELGNTGSTPLDSSVGGKNLGEEASTSTDKAVPASAASSSRQKAASGGGKRGAGGKMRKYLCFMPFLY